VITPTHRVGHNVASLYRAADSSSEQISQTIWGSPVERIDESGSFAKVITEDLYTGWIRRSFLFPIDDDQDSAVSTIASLFAEVLVEPTPKSEILTRLTTGARIVVGRLPSVGPYIPIVIPGQTHGYVHEGHVSMTYSPKTTSLKDVTTTEPVISKKILALILDRISESSKLFVGVPYLWGGTTPFGMDCSGFTQLVYKVNGIQLRRDSGEQWLDKRFIQIQTEIGFAATAFERADLLFFSSDPNEEKRITHVGLALGDGRFIHSAGKERGNTISYCSEPYYVESFVGAKRLSGQNGLSIDASV